MKKTNIKRTFFALILCALSVAFVAQSAHAQDSGASAKFRPTPRDPFVKPRPAPPRVVKVVDNKPSAPKQLEVPPIQTRINNYKRLKVEAMTQQKTAPKPTTALLLNEVEVTGVFRTPRGYAAMIEAKPINLSYVIYPGEMFYDGQLVAIEETRLVFRREVRWTNGKRDLVAEYKLLRTPDSADDLALTKTSKGGEAKDEKNKDATAKDADDAGDATPAKKDESKKESARKVNRKATGGASKP